MGLKTLLFFNQEIFNFQKLKSSMLFTSFLRMLSREEAFVILKKYLKEPDNIRYSFAVEAVLRELSKILYRDEELWSLTGLLHNLDYEYTVREPEKRGTLSAQLLDGLIPENGVNAIKANNYMHTDYIPITSLDKSLIATDAMCMLIFTTAKALPSKKVAEVDINLLVQRFHDTSFAPRVNRSRIKLCVDLGIDLKAFLTLGLATIRTISTSLGL